jgi:uncharacterized protein YjbI with pentapeptide repeats
MADQAHVSILGQGVQSWNEWRRDNPSVQPDLKQLDFSGMNLSEANLSHINFGCSNFSRVVLGKADLSGSNLHLSNCYKAHFREANLRDAILTQVTLDEANLTKADLTQAVLRSASLGWALLHDAILRDANLNAASLFCANLSGADLSGASFEKAVLGQTVFGNTNLSRAVGLESCIHLEGSTIDDWTLALSGPFPLSFLRGCRVSEGIIRANQSAQFDSTFVSYSSRDQDFAERLYVDLKGRGVLCWFAPHSVRAGRKLHEQIGKAIRSYDRLLLILSEHSMNSDWVETEIVHAIKKEVDENRHVLFPISIVPFSKIRDWTCPDADTGKDLAREIRKYFIPDFSNWKLDDSYKNSLQRLIEDLKQTKED